MKTKTLWTWISLIIICMIPVVLLFFLGPDIDRFSNYADFTHTVGQIAGLIGMTLFTISFILAMRLKFIEDCFGGLDKVYIAHGIVGGSALMMILVHPLFLVLKYIPENIPLAAAYLLPGTIWSINFGIIALVGMLGLIFVTLYMKIRYQKWKSSHRFLGLAFLFAAFHVVLIRDIARDEIFTGYFTYAIIVSVIGLAAFIYTLFRTQIKPLVEYKIDSVLHENGTHTIVMKATKHPIKYRAGQFVFVTFQNKKLAKEPHPFSIASKSNNPKLKIVIKELGDYTSQLSVLKAGDYVMVEGPYGRFYEQDIEKDKIWIAGGVGITPFIGMTQDLVDYKIDKKIDLYYSVKDEKEFIELKGLQDVEKKYKGLKVIPWIANKDGFLTVDAIMKKTKNAKEREIYICGPPGLKTAIRQGFIKLGVIKNNIHEEEFNFK